MYKDAIAIRHSVYHDHVSKRGWNSKCYKTNSSSGLVNVFWGLGEFLKHNMQNWNKIS